MPALRYVISCSVALPRTNIDTDQIIPARFLSTTGRDGLGRHAFNDWRYLGDGTPNPDFAFNRAENAGRRILVAGRNFGCGSSREHAPWALLDLGLAAVVSAEIADIFRGNALKNGLLPVLLPEAVVDELLAHPEWKLTIDVASRTLAVPDGRQFEFPLDPFAQTCLLEGVDELGFLLARGPEISSFEKDRQESTVGAPGGATAAYRPAPPQDCNRTIAPSGAPTESRGTHEYLETNHAS